MSPHVAHFVTNYEGLLRNQSMEVVSAGIASYFPTSEDVRDAQALLERTGATTVLALGGNR